MGCHVGGKTQCMHVNTVRGTGRCIGRLGSRDLALGLRSLDELSSRDTKRPRLVKRRRRRRHRILQAFVQLSIWLGEILWRSTQREC